MNGNQCRGLRPESENRPFLHEISQFFGDRVLSRAAVLGELHAKNQRPSHVRRQRALDRFVVEHNALRGIAEVLELDDDSLGRFASRRRDADDGPAPITPPLNPPAV